jgi:hypothetical protein
VNRLLLLSHKDHPAAALAYLFEQFVPTNAIATNAIARFRFGAERPDQRFLSSRGTLKECARPIFSPKEFLDVLTQLGVAAADLLEVSAALTDRQFQRGVKNLDLTIRWLGHGQPSFTVPCEKTAQKGQWKSSFFGEQQ